MTLVNAVLYGADDVVGAHVRMRLRQSAAPTFDLSYAQDGTRLFAALGVVRPVNGERKLIGGAVFHGLHSVDGKAICIQVSVAFDQANWASRATLKQLFGYPFVQLGCATMVAHIRRNNKRARHLITGLGFHLVGPIPQAFDGREDVMLYAMVKDKCRWLKDRIDEQKRA